jgi:hypothetical protein
LLRAPLGAILQNLLNWIGPHLQARRHTLIRCIERRLPDYLDRLGD